MPGGVPQLRLRVFSGLSFPSWEPPESGKGRPDWVVPPAIQIAPDWRRIPSGRSGCTPAEPCIPGSSDETLPGRSDRICAPPVLTPPAPMSRQAPIPRVEHAPEPVVHQHRHEVTGVVERRLAFQFHQRGPAEGRELRPDLAAGWVVAARVRPFAVRQRSAPGARRTPLLLSEYFSRSEPGPRWTFPNSVGGANWSGLDPQSELRDSMWRGVSCLRGRRHGARGGRVWTRNRSCGTPHGGVSCLWGSASGVRWGRSGGGLSNYGALHGSYFPPNSVMRGSPFPARKPVTHV